jgi:hypothetical protein
MKLIRELRMGAPKSFKTGAVVGSYPKPMLYFGFDHGGIDVIPDKKTDGFDCTHADIDSVPAGKFALQATKPITMVDYSTVCPVTLALDYLPTKSQEGLQTFYRDYNQLASKKELPYKTIVFDSVTGYTDIILAHLSSFNPNAMADARQWAYQAGNKVRQLILSSTCLPAHVVFIMHSAVEKDELTQQIRELPSVYSGLRNDIGGLFSQVFYSAKNGGGKPVIWTSDKMFVKGIGPRWPAGLPQECAPDFQSIYGKEITQ